MCHPALTWGNNLMPIYSNIFSIFLHKILFVEKSFFWKFQHLYQKNELVSKLPMYQRCGICLVSLLHKMINLPCDNIWTLNDVDEFWIIHNSIQFKHPSGGSFPSPKLTLLSTSLQQHMKNECWTRKSILFKTFIMLVFLTNHVATLALGSRPRQGVARVRESRGKKPGSQKEESPGVIT